MKHKTNYLLLLSIFLLLISLGLLFLYFEKGLYPYLKYENIYETQCYVDNITFPDNIESLNWTNSSLYWKECRCGKRCYGDTALQTIHVSFQNNQRKILNNIMTIGLKPSQYTFVQYGNNTYCPYTFESKIKSMEQGIDVMKKYIGYLYNNSYINCYIYNETPYLIKVNNEVINNNFFGLSLILLLSSFIILYLSFIIFKIYLKNLYNPYNNILIRLLRSFIMFDFYFKDLYKPNNNDKYCNDEPIQLYHIKTINDNNELRNRNNSNIINTNINIYDESIY